MVDATDVVFYGSIGIAFATFLGASLWFSVKQKDSNNSSSNKSSQPEKSSEEQLDRSNLRSNPEAINRIEQNDNYFSTPALYDSSNQQHKRSSFENQTSGYDYTLKPRIDEIFNNQLEHEKQAASVEPPKCSNGTSANSIQWVNEIISLFYTQHDRYANFLCEALVNALNEKLNSITNASPDYCDLIVEFLSVNPESTSGTELRDINVEHQESGEKAVIITYKLHQARLAFELLVQRAPIATSATLATSDDSSLMIHDNKNYYELCIENLEGTLKSHASLQNKSIVTEVLGRANFKISIEPSTAFTSGSVTTSALNINEDALISMIAKSISQSMIFYYYGDDPDFPQFKSHQHYSSSRLYFDKLTHQVRESASELSRNLKSHFASSRDSDKKVLVKIIKAQNINYNENVTCLLELRSDQQVHASGQQIQLTSTKSGSNPHWDEHFIFNLPNEQHSKSATPNALVIGLWDSLNRPVVGNITSESTKSKKKNQQNQQPIKDDLIKEATSLGCAIITVEEICSRLMQKVSLKLKSFSEIPNDGDIDQQQAAGELLVELVLMEHSLSPAHSGAQLGIARSPSGNSIMKMIANAADQGSSSELINIERRVSQNTPAYLVTTERPHSAQSDQNLEPPTAPVADSTSLKSAELTPSEIATKPESPRGRSRSFIRALRSRLSFKRSRSIGGTGSPISRPATESPGPCADSRSRMSSECSYAIDAAIHRSGAKTLPGSREPSEVPAIVINRNNSNAMEFKPAKSLLVFECTELVPVAKCLNKKRQLDSTNQRQDNLDSTDLTASSESTEAVINQPITTILDEDEQEDEQPDVIVKYYAIDGENESLAKRLRKRGVKLHFFNEHQFIACHLPSSSTCHNCGRVFSRRPGKQGYKCRNCHLLAHKQCHTKVDHQCPYPKPAKESIKLEFINEEPGQANQERKSLLSRSSSLRIWPNRSTLTPQDQSRSGSIASTPTVIGNSSRFNSLRRLTNPSKLSSKSISVELEDNNPTRVEG